MYFNEYKEVVFELFIESTNITILKAVNARLCHGIILVADHIIPLIRIMHTIFIE